MATLHQIERQVEMLAEMLSQIEGYGAETLSMLRPFPSGQNAATAEPEHSSPTDRISHKLELLSSMAARIGGTQREIREHLFGESDLAPTQQVSVPRREGLSLSGGWVGDAPTGRVAF